VSGFVRENNSDSFPPDEQHAEYKYAFEGTLGREWPHSAERSRYVEHGGIFIKLSYQSAHFG
jgi:hypothetical protein